MAYSIKNISHVDVLHDMSKSYTLSSARVEDSSIGLSFDSVRKESGIAISNHAVHAPNHLLRDKSSVLSPVSNDLVQSNKAESSFDFFSTIRCDACHTVSLDKIQNFTAVMLQQGFSHEMLTSMIVSSLARPVEVLQTETSESTRSTRSINRAEYRNTCRNMHLNPGYCYLAPVAWKVRKDFSELLGPNPSIGVFFTELSKHADSIRELQSFYVIKVSDANLGSYHLSRNSHGSLGTLPGLVNGLKDKWAARGSSLEKFPDLPITVGHNSFTIPLGATIGADDPSLSEFPHQLDRTDSFDVIQFPSSPVPPSDGFFRSFTVAPHFINSHDLRFINLAHWRIRPAVLDMLQGFISLLLSLEHSTVTVMSGSTISVSNTITCSDNVFLLIKRFIFDSDVKWFQPRHYVQLQEIVNGFIAFSTVVYGSSNLLTVNYDQWSVVSHLDYGFKLQPSTLVFLVDCPGYCYLNLVQPNRRPQVVARVGIYPTLSALEHEVCSFPCSLYLTATMISAHVSLRYVPDAVHITDACDAISLLAPNIRIGMDSDDSFDSILDLRMDASSLLSFTYSNVTHRSGQVLELLQRFKSILSQVLTTTLCPSDMILTCSRSLPFELSTMFDIEDDEQFDYLFSELVSWMTALMHIHRMLETGVNSDYITTSVGFFLEEN